MCLWAVSHYSNWNKYKTNSSQPVATRTENWGIAIVRTLYTDVYAHSALCSLPCYMCFHHFPLCLRSWTFLQE